MLKKNTIQIISPARLHFGFLEINNNQSDNLLGGIGFVLPIGGGDMPVVISLLNSFSGIAAAFPMPTPTIPSPSPITTRALNLK